MDPSCDHDGSPYRNVFWTWAKVSDDSHFAVIQSQGLAYDGLTNAIFALWLTETLQKLAAVWVSVWEAMRKVDLIVIVLELKSEAQCVVVATAFLLHCVLEVADVFTISIPTNALTIVSLSFFLGIEQRFQTLVEGWVRLQHVDKIELVVDSFPYIVDTEVVPLSISSGVVVVPQMQVVLIFTDLLCTS